MDSRILLHSSTQNPTQDTTMTRITMHRSQPYKTLPPVGGFRTASELSTPSPSDSDSDAYENALDHKTATNVCGIHVKTPTKNAPFRVIQASPKARKIRKTDPYDSEESEEKIIYYKEHFHTIMDGRNLPLWRQDNKKKRKYEACDKPDDTPSCYWCQFGLFQEPEKS